MMEFPGRIGDFPRPHSIYPVTDFTFGREATQVSIRSPAMTIS